MGKWRKFLRLSWPEMGFFFLALFLLPVTALALKLMGLRRTQVLLMRLAPCPRPHGENEVGSSRVDLQACKLEYSIVSPK